MPHATLGIHVLRRTYGATRRIGGTDACCHCAAPRWWASR